MPDYDDIIAQKAVQLFTEQQEGKEERAVLMDQKIDRSIARRQQDSSGPVVKRMLYKENPLYGLFRIGYSRSSKRFGGKGF